MNRRYAGPGRPAPIDCPFRRATLNMQIDVLVRNTSSAANTSAGTRSRSRASDSELCGQLDEHRQADARQNLRRRRRDQTSGLPKQHHVGRGGLDHVSRFVEHQGPAARLPFVGLPVGQIIVHPAAALQLRRPAAGRNLLDVRRRQRPPLANFAAHRWKLQRKGVQANGRPRRTAGSSPRRAPGVTNIDRPRSSPGASKA